MKKSLKIILIAAAAIILILAAIQIISRYNSEYRPHDVAELKSDDGVYSVLFQQIGDPEWPFGKTDVRVTLMKDGKKISVYDGSIKNDGKNAGEGNIECSWNENGVRITLTGEEQKPIYFAMLFDGRMITDIID